MAVDERARHELRARLEEILGTDEATTLMHYLPPMDWSEVATKRDLDQLADRLRAEMRELFGDVRRELHQEVGGLRRELHQEIGGLRRELHQEIGGLRSDMSAQGRNLFFGMLASNATLVGLVFAAMKLA